MKEAGLDHSSYYHIRDWHVSSERFARFMSRAGTAMMARWWNRMPQYDGLFDFQNAMRPSYFSFKLLGRLSGERLRLKSTHPAVRGLLAYDELLRLHNLLLWNFSGTAVRVNLALEGLPRDLKVRPIVLDSLAAGADENSRLRPEPLLGWEKGGHHFPLHLEPRT